MNSFCRHLDSEKGLRAIICKALQSRR